MRTLIFWVKFTTIAVMSVIAVTEILSDDRTKKDGRN